MANKPKTIFSHAAEKGGVAYDIVANREELGGKARYRVYIGAHYNDGVYKYAPIGTARCDSAAECNNYALTAAAQWINN